MNLLVKGFFLQGRGGWFTTWLKGYFLFIICIVEAGSTEILGGFILC